MNRDTRLKHLESTGQTARMQQDFKAQVENQADNPIPIQRLTTTPRTFYIGSSLTLAADIKDTQGNILYPKGLTINPFDTETWPGHIPKVQFEYQHTVVFLDGDPRQRSWAKQYVSEKPVKWILTRGSPRELASELDARMYFDQQGHYSKLFRLSHIPSVIEQDGKRWRVTEVDGCVVNVNSTFLLELFNNAITEFVSEVVTESLKNNVGREMATFKHDQ